MHTATAMSVSIPNFWKLVAESRLLSAADCQRLDASFATFKGATAQGNAATLGEWLVAGGMLSDYQVKTLLRGRSGPFFYGDYCVYDKLHAKDGRLGGLLRALHLPTRHPVLLYRIAGPTLYDPASTAAAVRQVAWACWVGNPYVAQCYQWLDLDEYKLVVLEDLVGDTLAAQLVGGKRFAAADVCRLGAASGDRLGPVASVGSSPWIGAAGQSLVATGRQLEAAASAARARAARRAGADRLESARPHRQFADGGRLCCSGIGSSRIGSPTR